MRSRFGVAFGGGLLAVAFLAGCDSRPEAPPSQSKAAPAPPVQGELIQSKPSPTASPAAAAAPSPSTGNVASVSAPETVSKPAAASNAIPAAEAVARATNGTNSLSLSSEPPKLVNGFLGVGFDRLSAFTFEVTDDILQSTSTNAVQVASRTAEQIPKTVMSYDQKRIALKGFMLPLKVEGGKVTEMLIMRDQSMCCYGAVPKINEWVSVKMVGEGVRPIMDQAVTLYGKLYVGEMRENGYLVGIYRMDGERIDGPAEN